MMNTVASKAARTAEVIHAVKMTLLVLNGLGSLAMIIIGFASASSNGTDEYGFENSGPNPISVGIGLYGLAAGVLGTLVILVVLGWFEHMLRANAELVRLAWLSSSESPMAVRSL